METHEEAAEQPGGFTWVEVMVAMLLTAVGLLAIAPVFLVAARSSAAATDLGVLGTRSAFRMEILRNVPFDELRAGGDLSANAAGYFDDADPACLLRWTIADGGEPVTRKTITVVGLATRRPLRLQKEVRLAMVRVR